MNDRDFETLLATEFAKPPEHEPSADFVTRILARADDTRRRQRLVLTGAAAAGVAATIGIVTTFASLEAVARGFNGLVAALPGPGLAPVAVLCLVLTITVGIRSRVA